MLKNIDPLLGADLLQVLRQMGHGDVLALVDRNFPAESHGQRVIQLPGANIGDAARAIFSLFPVDTFVTPAAWRMGPVDDPSASLDVHADFADALAVAEGHPVEVEPLERFEFYRRAKQAFAVVATSEDRPYGCFLVTKGVVTD